MTEIEALKQEAAKLEHGMDAEREELQMRIKEAEAKIEALKEKKDERPLTLHFEQSR